ncbi:hypothetical protein FHS43_001905 [Streptosporangium becharense]|uniref:Uncharacterized protein n=1 Tax=Streptosporangium becharense TaxID=1816182 RepID=A0A7W9IAU5_9ACTN|nr:hypothetical protein [Streptosporangium becharense]MBB2910642.1 hypothetical protein [Streptosporangium becharense]MBB5817337.1 hypothetical protein [Streptosporangium becharense]
MAGESARDPSPRGRRGLPEIDPALRAAAAASAGGTLVIWWPAFTLGAYDAVFFDAVLAIWAVATAVLLAPLVLRTRGALPWAGWIALALPSVWIVLAVVAPRSHGFRYLHYFEVVLTLVGAPALTWLLSRILLPEYAELPERYRLRAVAVTIAVGVLAFLLGKFNYLFLTCADFDVSGNNTPPGCANGPPFHLL